MTSKNFEPRDDILIELILTFFYNVKATNSFNKDIDCGCCLQSLKGKYVYEINCDNSRVTSLISNDTHIFCRKCYLNFIINHNRELEVKCMSCNGICPRKFYDVDQYDLNT
jgi:hypothetical protein